MRHICSFLYIPFPFSNGLPGLDCISALIELVFQSFTRYGLKKGTLRHTKPHCHLVLMPIFGESRFSGEVTCWLLIVGRPPCYHFQRRVGGGGCEVLQGILYQTFMDALITE